MSPHHPAETKAHPDESAQQRNGYATLRSNLASSSDADVAKAVAYGKRTKVFPLAQAANSPPTIFVDTITSLR